MRPTVGQEVVRDGGGVAGTPLPLGRVAKVTDEYIEIKWDNEIGTQQVLVKENGTFGLRVYNNRNTTHPQKRCHECGIMPIVGLLWQCQRCSDCWMCTICYMKNCHSAGAHLFYRFTDSTIRSRELMPRRDTRKLAKIVGVGVVDGDVFVEHLPSLSVFGESHWTTVLRQVPLEPATALLVNLSSDVTPNMSRSQQQPTVLITPPLVPPRPSNSLSASPPSINKDTTSTTTSHESPAPQGIDQQQMSGHHRSLSNAEHCEEDALTCPVCFLAYASPEDSMEKTPLILTKCGHTLCKKCADGICKDKSIACPVCRTITEVENGSSNLNKNFSLLNILQLQKIQFMRLQSTNSDSGQSLRRVASSGALLDETAAVKAFSGICLKHNRNLSLWCAVCCEVLCLGCVDVHAGHERLTSEELPSYMSSLMNSLKPQLAECVQDLKASSSRMIGIVDKFTKEMKEFKRYWKDEDAMAENLRGKVEEYRKNLDDLSLEEMIAAWRRADRLVNELKSKTTQSDSLCKELDKDVNHWHMKKHRLLGPKLGSQPPKPQLTPESKHTIRGQNKRKMNLGVQQTKMNQRTSMSPMADQQGSVRENKSRHPETSARSIFTRLFANP